MSSLRQKKEVHRRRCSQHSDAAGHLKQSLSSTLQRSMALAEESGSFSWFTALPVAEFGFTLHKSAFCDALFLRHGWLPTRIPNECECGTQFSVEHILSYPKGDFPSIRQNKIRDLTANLMSEVCNDVYIEPHLQPITGEHLPRGHREHPRRCLNGYCYKQAMGDRYERTYFDVGIFNPHATSNRQTNLSACYRKHEGVQKSAYEQRVQEIEHSFFTPLVMSSTGGLRPAALTTYKRLATLLPAKWDQPYSLTMNWLRCCL